MSQLESAIVPVTEEQEQAAHAFWEAMDQRVDCSYPGCHTFANWFFHAFPGCVFCREHFNMVLRTNFH